jgi:prophage regulatory protein
MFLARRCSALRGYKMKLLSYDELKPAKGISYSRCQLWRLEKIGRFPKRVRLGAGRHGWAEHEIDNWIGERIRERDAALAPAAA